MTSIPLATACVIYHKFFSDYSLKDYDPYVSLFFCLFGWLVGWVLVVFFWGGGGCFVGGFCFVFLVVFYVVLNRL